MSFVQSVDVCTVQTELDISVANLPHHARGAVILPLDVRQPNPRHDGVVSPLLQGGGHLRQLEALARAQGKIYLSTSFLGSACKSRTRLSLHGVYASFNGRPRELG